MTFRRSLRKLAVAVPISVAVLAIFAVFAHWAERTRNASEEYAVYSAYLSQGIAEDAHDWSVDAPIEVVVTDTTKVGTLRWWPLYALDFRRKFDRISGVTNYSFLVRNLLRTPVTDRFRLPRRASVAIATESEAESPDFYKRHPRAIGYLTLSGVGFNATRTQAMFYIDHFCGLCGGGRYVLMNKVDGQWRVADEHYTWIS